MSAALADLDGLQPWRIEALCRARPELLDLMFSNKTRDQVVAKAICASCPVRNDCLGYALDAGEDDHGIWGGKDPTERRRIRAELERAKLTRRTGRIRLPLATLKGVVRG